MSGNASRQYCDGSNQTNAGLDAEVSRWNLLFDLTMFVPASIAGMLLMSWSDKVGRKAVMVVPVISMTISSVIFALVIHYQWPLKALFLVNLTAGLGGYYMTLLMQGLAYLTDITTADNRGIRFVVVETSLGIAGGVAGVSSGYWLDATGFFAPVAFTAILNFIILLLLPCLADSTKIKNNRRRISTILNSDDVTQSSDDSSRSNSQSSLIPSREGDARRSYTFLDLLRSVWKVYSSEYSDCPKCDDVKENSQSGKCIHGGGRYPGRVWRMWFYLAAYDLYMFVTVGVLEFQTIYFLSPPLCFSQVLVGLQTGVKYIGVAASPFFVLFYQRVLNLENNTIAIIGLSTLMMSSVAIAIATETYLVFIGTVILLFSFVAKPFIQTQMSGLVSEWEQGSAFALLSFSEILTFLAASTSFLTLYPATITIYHGFCWLFAAAISAISILFVTLVAPPPSWRTAIGGCPLLKVAFNDMLGEKLHYFNLVKLGLFITMIEKCGSDRSWQHERTTMRIMRLVVRSESRDWGNTKKAETAALCLVGS